MSIVDGASTQSNVIKIDWYDENDEIVVTAKNQLRFSIQKDRAIEALRVFKEAERFSLQFTLLLEEKLARWIKNRSDHIRTAFLTLRENFLVFVVVQSDVAYNGELQDDLADLEFTITQDTDLDLIRLRTVMLPPVDDESLGSFLDPKMLIEYQHGK